MIIYDCEIIKAVPQRNEERLSDIEYCDGWDDVENMGISVICAYDYETERYRTFLEDNSKEFQALVDDADLVIGFNSLKFDNTLCRAHGLSVPDEKSYDLLVEIWKGAGLGPKFEYPSHVGFGLDVCSKANFGTEKTHHGALAPVDWQRGNYGVVIDYCLNDVKLTKDLIDRVIERGCIHDPRNAEDIIEVVSPIDKL